VAARLIEVAREAFRLPQIDYHKWTVLRKIPGYDVATFVRLVLSLDAEFGITLQEDEVDRFETMGDIVTLLRARLAVPVGVSETVK
jgi:acyl carrier protein